MCNQQVKRCVHTVAHDPDGRKSCQGLLQRMGELSLLIHGE
ncbi:MAG: hypothetical protein Q8O31_00120 [Rhodocyclaceae bacterium]|nr:hypothetical protein [Rhodocyclaceae bacterium]